MKLELKSVYKYTFLPLTLLQKVRLLFIKYSTLYFNIRKKKRVTPTSTELLTIMPLRTKKGTLRRYTRRFYRRVLKKRYDRTIKIYPVIFSLWKSRVVWNKPFTPKVSFKSFFHIKTFFNINEFLLYDFYNFHRTILNSSLTDQKIPKKFIAKKPWKKLNFFFQIKYSIDTFRTHTLQFFKIKFKSDRRVTVFFNTIKSLTPLNYIWFFEYSIPYFLVKIRFAESISQGLLLCSSNVIFVNYKLGFNRWDFIRPGDLIQMPFNTYTLMRLKWMITKFFDFFKRTKKFFKRTILRSRKYRIKMPNMTAKSNHLVNSKHLHFRLMESDYKSLTVILLPYINPLVYYSVLTLFWLNFWNFRLNVWKYEI